MTATVGTIPPVRQVRVRLRRVRRTHSDRTLGEFLTDVYLIGFLVVLYGGSAVVSIQRHMSKPFGGPAGLESTRAWLVVALLAVVGALAWRGLRSFGPLLTTPAALSWCVSTPIDRATWLRKPLVWLLACCGVVGAAVGTVASWAGLPGWLGWGPLAGVGTGVALAAAAVVAEARSGPPARPTGRPTVADAVLLLGLALILGAEAARIGHVTVGPPALSTPIAAAAGIVLAVTMTRSALSRLSTIDRAALSGGAQLAAAASTAAVMLDPALLSSLVESRRWRTARKVHSRRWWPGSAQWVLFQADLRRQWRRRANLLTWAALLLAPYATEVFSPAAVGPVRIVAAYLAVERLASGLRAVARSSSLRRMLGGSDGELKLIHLAVPAVGLTVWWTLTTWAGAAAYPTVELIIVLGVLGAVYRTATRPPMSYDAGLADTPMGPVPTLLLRRLLRGPDLVAVLVLIDLLVPSP